jgi:hypothetical protein
MKILAPLAIVISMLLLGGPAKAANACPGKVLFSDNFSTLDSAWGASSADSSVYRNMFMLTAPSGTLIGRLNLTHRVQNFAACAVAALVTAANNHDPGGLVFWAAGTTDYYVFAIDSLGSFAVFHVSAGREDPILKWQATKALKTGAGVWNALQVAAVGDQATLAINGQQVGQITGSAPAQGGFIGFVVDADASGVAHWAFAGLNVTDGVAQVAPAPPSISLNPDYVPGGPPAQTEAPFVVPGMPQPFSPAAATSPAQGNQRPKPEPETIHEAIPTGVGGAVYLTNGPSAIEMGSNKGGKIAIEPTKCALTGAWLASLAIDSQGDIFAGTNDGRVLVCMRASGSVQAFRAGDANAPAGVVSVSLGFTGDLYVLIAAQTSVANSSPPEIAHYAIAEAGGAPNLLSVTAGPATEMTNPQGLAVDAQGRILVLDEVGVADRILIFAPGANGDIPPSAIIGNQTGIVGDKTGLVGSAAIAVDQSGRIYVANAATDLAGTYDANTASVTVYAANAVGNSAPIATIIGPDTNLSGDAGMGIALDGKGDIWVGTTVATQSGPGVVAQKSTAITAYAASSQGNVAPIGKFLTAGYVPSLAVYPAGAIGMLAPAPN